MRATVSPGKASQELLQGSFAVQGGNTFIFQIGAYDRTATLVIDPAIAYSTTLSVTGAAFVNYAVAVFTDPATNHVYAYVDGTTMCDPDKSAMRADCY